MSINLVQWEGSTVTPKLDAIMYDDGSYGIIKGCAITHQGTNLLKIANGFIKIAGRLIEIAEETIQCQVSASGTVNGQLWIRLDLSSVTPAVFMTEAAAVLTPLTQNADCNFQNGIYELQLATYNIDESVITNLVETAPVLEPLRTGLTASGINYDNTHSGLTATKVQGAIDEINDNLTWYIQNGWLPVRPSGDVPANMEDCSWAMLKSLAAAGTLGNYYQIGDTKTIELTGGERVVMELVSINDGEGTAGGYYPRGTVDFISKDCLQTKRSMNSSSTNAGGWVSCALRTTLNTTIYKTLPQAVKDVIVEKTHKTSAGSQSTSLVEHSDKLWLPTEYEMFGAITYSANTENANVNKHYAVFDTNADRIKHQGTNGSAVVWWESSPDVSHSTDFCYVDTSGGANIDGTKASYGVPLCFRIGQLYT
jgi:hypothetical protein